MIVTPVASDLIRDAVMSAQIIVLQDAGYDQSRIEISAGLALAWADPASEQRWLAGGPAFPSAAAPEATGHRPGAAFAVEKTLASASFETLAAPAPQHGQNAIST